MHEILKKKQKNKIKTTVTTLIWQNETEQKWKS
jgi:hypothetical protein